MKKLLTLLLLLTLSITSYAQDFELPENMVMNTDADYASFEPQILEAIAWRAKTPIHTETQKRKSVNAFLLQWMSGSPTVSILVNSKIGESFMSESEYLMSYMTGWTAYSLTHNYSNNDHACSKAAILHVIDFYEKNKAVLGKRGGIEKLIKLQKKGKLDTYISKALKE